MASKIVERVLGKLVGHEISVKELEEISGGTISCPRDQIATQYSNTPYINCDKKDD